MEPLEQFLNHMVARFCLDCLDAMPAPILRFVQVLKMPNGYPIKGYSMIEDGELLVLESVLTDYLNLDDVQKDIKYDLLFEWSCQFPDAQDWAYIWKGHQLNMQVCHTDRHDRILAEIIRLGWSPTNDNRPKIDRPEGEESPTW